MKYLPLFLLIQIINIPFMVLGWVVCLWPHLAHATWIWWNDEDPPWTMSWWKAYMWLAWRNSVANYKHVPGVSKVGRPLWITNFTVRGKIYYAKAGWLSNGYPCLSAGAGQW